jgi:hypothetical protein
MRRFSYFTAAFSLLLVFLVPPAKADPVIFSNLVSGGSLVTNGGFGIGPGIPGDGVALAAQFIPSSTSIFTSATLPLGSNVGTPMADVFLMTDASGVPGTILESFITNTGLSTTTGQFFTLNSVLNPELMGGTPYWLAVTAVDSSSNVSWRRDSGTDINSASNLAGSDTGSSGPWFLISAGAVARPAFQVNGTPVPTPEPNTLLLLAIGLAGLVFIARSTRKRALA